MLVSGLFILFAVFDLIRRWDQARVSVATGPVILAFVLAGCAMSFQYLGWRSLVGRLCARTMPWRPSARLYIDSQLARYTPGKVGLPAVRIAGASTVGVPPEVMVTSLGVELMSWSAMGVTTGLCALLLFTQALSTVPADSVQGLPVSGLVELAALLSVAGVLVLTALDRRFYPQKVLSILKLKGDGPLLPWTLPLWHLLNWLCWIGVGTCLSVALGHSYAEGIWAGAALVLGIVAGFLALLAPAGAGVREVIIAYALAPLWGPAMALSFGLLARAVSLLSDVLLWLSFRFTPRSREL
jgi:hypothetical protein